MSELKTEYRVIIFSPFEKTPHRIVFHESLQEAQNHGDLINQNAGFSFEIQERQVTPWEPT